MTAMTAKPPFYFPNGDGDQSPDRYHLGVIIEKTGEDNDDTKKLRTMHVYSRSVNILYGKVACSEDWRDYRLGDWMLFTMRNGKYFSNVRCEAPYETRVSATNNVIIQVHVHFFLVPDFIRHRTISRDRKRYYKMWSPELGGCSTDEFSMQRFGMNPDDKILWRGWLQTSVDMNFGSGHLDADGWPYDRSVYWELVWEAGQQEQIERIVVKGRYEEEANKLYVESEKQALARIVRENDRPIMDQLGEQFSRRNYKSPLEPETTCMPLPKIKVESQEQLRRCFIGKDGLEDGLFTPVSHSANSSGDFGFSSKPQQPKSSSLMTGFGFSAFGGNNAATPAVTIGSDSAQKTNQQGNVPNRPVFSGKGFDYGEYYARQGSPSPPPPTQRLPPSTNQGFGFFKSDTAPTPQNLSAPNIGPSSQSKTEVRSAVSGSGFHQSSGFGFRPNSANNPDSGFRKNPVNKPVSGFHPSPINNSGVHPINNVERNFRNLNVSETKPRSHARSVQNVNDDKPNSGFNFQFKKGADETKSPEQQQSCERPRPAAGPRIVNGAVYGGFTKAAVPRSSYSINNNMEKK